MSAPSYAVYSLLNDAEYFSGWSVFIGRMPEADATVKHNCVALFDFIGRDLSRCYNKALPAIEQPSVQIKVRSTSYATGEEKIRAISRFLDQHDKWTVGDVIYHSVFQKGSYFPLTLDEQGRTLWVANFRVVLEDHSA